MNTIAIKRAKIEEKVSGSMRFFSNAREVFRGRMIMLVSAVGVRKPKKVSIAALSEGSLNEVWDNKYDAQYDAL